MATHSDPVGLSRSPRGLSVNELAARWRQHSDRQARDALFDRFLPLARKLAGRYANPHEPLEDLVQVASLGLVGAIDRFDPGRGTSFSGFAIPTILGDTGWAVHVPRGAQEMALRIDRATRQITARRGQAPRVDELAQYLEVAPDDILRGLEASDAHYAISLDAPASHDDTEETGTLGETIGRRDAGYSLVDTASSLTVEIARLPHQERRALTLRLETGMKQAEIARELGCSQMQVSRLLRSAAARLRDIAPGEAP